MTLAEVIALARATPNDAPYHNRFLFADERTETAEDLLRDTSLEVRSVPFEGDVPQIPGLKNLCLFQTVVEVLETWASWRGGREPSPDAAAKAIMWYLENDAFIRVEQG